ncbi:serine/threonine-protein kinase [Nocardioides sp. cx-173]|uniref:serine/threonine-protein kinase n=1 Tax=Nocardioides sp. cx-173 TaxID=2898796 RepID=UPI001E511364|nr:serine/threonine-protein kinase [Nocardioides sp. cx-173]MCD4523917.1 serine/threonine protein kinase [Nocardioides sp. cx-173]UGB44110.1 serine/threonine protein kinase [Nocardioides sp. cx-173]
MAGYPEPGEMVGPYRVERRLGLGGMGVVFVALDPVLERRVALKVIAPHLAEDETFRARFTREAQAQASLDSPHVVHVYAHGESGGRLYIATQLIDGGDLGQLIHSSGPPPLRVGLDLIAQIAGGLAAAHARGLIHRDIKPANVLVGRRESGLSAYLADFGIARRVDGQSQLTTAGGTLGTPTYMAPELHLGAEPGVPSDVYSLGCLLWSAMSGEAPYAGTSDYQIITAHLEGPVPQLPETSLLARETNRVLRRAMAKRPEDRYPSAAALRDDLLAVLRLPDQDAGPAPQSLGPLGPRRPRRRLLLVAAAASALLLAGIVTAYAVTRDDDSGSADPSGPSDPSDPSEPSGSATPSGSDEDQAIAALATGFEPVAGDSARCMAEQVVGSVGVPALVEAGFFDEDWRFLDPDLAGQPQIKQALNAATFACIGEVLPSITP